MSLRAVRAVALGGALLGAAPGDAPAQERFVRGHALERTGAVRVFSMAGSVTVVGWDRDSVHVAGAIGAGLKPYAGGTRTAYKVATYEGRQDPASAAHIEIHVPRRAQLWIKTTTAPVTVRGVEGGVDVYTIDGNVSVTGSPSEVAAESMRGSVTIRGTPTWVRAKAGTGAVRFDGAARDLAISTVSGRIRSSSRFDRGRFESVRGDIELVGPLRRAASADIDSHAGAVTMRLGPAVSAAFTVYSVSGRITNALSATQARASRSAGSELAFDVGAADSRVTVRTFAGAVALLAR